jgi:hypothetical protein
MLSTLVDFVIQNLFLGFENGFVAFLWRFADLCFRWRFADLCFRSRFLNKELINRKLLVKTYLYEQVISLLSTVPEVLLMDNFQSRRSWNSPAGRATLTLWKKRP